MKIVSIFLLLFVAGIRLSIAQTVSIPDPNFLQMLIDLGVDKSKDGQIQSLEAVEITNLNVAGQNIADLGGIEAFINLDTLNCSSNILTSLDLSNNTKLTMLYCSINKLTSLDVSKNSSLVYLYCSNNKLISIDLFSKPNLKNLDCSFNKITSLDVSTNTVLSILECYSNMLTDLNLSKNGDLTQLFCDNNQLTSLDLSNNTNLAAINCSYNKLASIDLTKSTAVNILSCYSNNLIDLDVSKNTSLAVMDCGANPFANLNLSKNTNLVNLDCAGSPNLIFVCLADTSLASLHHYFKDNNTQWTEDCTILAINDNILASNQLQLSPNPSKEIFYLSLEQIARVSIYNAKGCELESFDGIQHLAFGYNYAPGLYFVNVYHANGNTKTAIRIIKE